MKLFIEPKMWGLSEVDEKMELTTELLDSFIERAKVFEKINFEPQVLADLVMEFPSDKERTQALMERYHVSRDQALLAQRMPLCEAPLYFFKEEYYRQIERLKLLRQIVQEVKDILD